MKTVIFILIIFFSCYSEKPDYIFDDLWKPIDGQKGFFFYKVQDKIIRARLLYRENNIWTYYGYRYQTKDIFIRGLTDKELKKYKKLTNQNRTLINKIFKTKYWSRHFKEWLRNHPYLKFIL